MVRLGQKAALTPKTTQGNRDIPISQGLGHPDSHSSGALLRPNSEDSGQKAASVWSTGGKEHAAQGQNSRALLQHWTPETPSLCQNLSLGLMAKVSGEE